MMMMLETRKQLLELARVVEDYWNDMEVEDCEEPLCSMCEWQWFCEQGWPPGRVISVLRAAAKKG